MSTKSQARAIITSVVLSRSVVTSDTLDGPGSVLVIGVREKAWEKRWVFSLDFNKDYSATAQVPWKADYKLNYFVLHASII